MHQYTVIVCAVLFILLVLFMMPNGGGSNKMSRYLAQGNGSGAGIDWYKPIFYIDPEEDVKAKCQGADRTSAVTRSPQGGLATCWKCQPGYKPNMEPIPRYPNLCLPNGGGSNNMSRYLAQGNGSGAGIDWYKPIFYIDPEEDVKAKCQGADRTSAVTRSPQGGLATCWKCQPGYKPNMEPIPRYPNLCLPNGA